MNTIYFLANFIISLAIVIAIDFLLKNKIEKKYGRVIHSAVKLVLSLGCALLVLTGPKFLRPVQPLLVTFYIVLLGDCFADIIFIFFSNRRFTLNKILSIFLSVVYLIGGMFNINYIKENVTYIETSKISRDYDFAFISDMHIGSSQDLSVSISLVNKIREKDYDFVILGGDISDDYSTWEEVEEFYGSFKDFTCPVYFIYGNHDYNTGLETKGKVANVKEKLESILSSNNIQILEDEFVSINNEITILGRKDVADNSRSDYSSLPNEYKTGYFIIADHTPSDTKQISSDTYNLQLSGHTHAGQFAPVGLIYELFGTYNYGMYDCGNAKLLVSSGVGGWRVPFRTAANCEYETIYLVKK